MDDPQRYVVCVVLADGVVKTLTVDDWLSAVETAENYVHDYLSAICSILITPIPA